MALLLHQYLWLQDNPYNLLLTVAYKKNTYEGSVEAFIKYDIVLNVNHLKKGAYTLKIMHKNKIIKKTTFKK